MARKTDSNIKVPIIPKSAPVMKATLTASLLCHILLLLGLQRSFPVDWFSKPLQAYQVELLRLPVDESMKDQEETRHVAEPKPEEQDKADETVDTISLDTKDKRYSSYAKIIKARLAQHWQYPTQALENLTEGDVLVLFSLDRQGTLIELQVVQSSGQAILDNETKRAIRAAAPFPSFPGSVTVKRLNIKANFVYKLTGEDK
jgi:TonB family protein